MLLPGTRPVYAQLAAAHAHPHLGVQEPAAPADGHRRAGAGAAGERLAGAALVDAQPDAAAVDDLHEAGVHPPREARMALDRRTQRARPGAASTDSTVSTACGLPMETAPISSVRPATSSG